MGASQAGPKAAREWHATMSQQETEQFLAQLDETFVNFSWCIWHEGVRAFDENYPGQMRDINTIRNEAINFQRHNPHAQDLIRAATNDQLTAMVFQTRARVYGEFQLVANFRWVAYHERQRDQFRQNLSRRDFPSIRTLYGGKQSQNPNAKNLLAAVSNQDIEVIVNSL